MKVLITQPKGKEQLVQAFKEAGAEVLNPKGSYVKPDLIIPVVDEELPTFAYLRPYFEAQGTRVMVGSPETIFQTRDKAEFNLFCRRHSFLYPRTMQGHTLVVKPRFGKASQGVHILDGNWLVQQKLEGREVSIDYFADFDGNPISVIPRFRENILNGQSTEWTECFLNEYSVSEIMRMGRELNLVGHNVIQGFLVEDSFYFTEVNCRYGGGSWLTFHKFSSPRWLCDAMRKVREAQTTSKDTKS